MVVCNAATHFVNDYGETLDGYDRFQKDHDCQEGICFPMYLRGKKSNNPGIYETRLWSLLLVLTAWLLLDGVVVYHLQQEKSWSQRPYESQPSSMYILFFVTFIRQEIVTHALMRYKLQ
jgi:hypothetical protein